MIMVEDGNKTIDIEGEASERGGAIEEVEEEEEEEYVEMEEGGGEEEEEEVEEEDYYCSFEFENGMDPLDFTEDDAFGIQPYQRLERLEYEALAEKKRKALSLSHPNISKKARTDDISGANIEEIMESVNYGGRRRRKRKLLQEKKRGRRKGSKNKLSPELTLKLGNANLHYAHGCYEEAIRVLKEVVRLAPNLPDSYHTLGLVYKAMGDNNKAINFYMLAAHFSPRDPSLWKFLVTWSIEQGNTGQARYCLSKAISADPEDISLRYHDAALHIELGNFQNAAESFVKISRLCPENIEALKTGAKLYLKCGQVERSVSILEDYLKEHPSEADLSVVDLLVSTRMEIKKHDLALQHIEHAHRVYCSSKELPLSLSIKAGICHLYLGNVERAKNLFSVLQQESADENCQLIMEVANSFVSLQQYKSALKYYEMLEGNGINKNGVLNLKIAECYLSLNEKPQAISFFYKALTQLEDNIDARLTLASLLLEEAKVDEAILLLSPPEGSESISDSNSDRSMLWWFNGKVKLKLSHIYRAKGMAEEFVDAIFLVVRESLLIESMQHKVKVRKRLSRCDLFERVKILDDGQTDAVFHGFRPIAPTSDLSRASRAKRLLQKKAMLKEERKAAALAAGVEWQSDNSDNESPQQVLKDPPIPNLLKDEEHHRLIVDLCKALASLRRYWEALEIINHILRLAYNALSSLKKEELRSLGAQIAYNITDPKHGFDSVKYIVQQHPHSLAAWSCYYKVISRLENRYSKHYKFLHGMRIKLNDCVPPMIIVGHQLTMISQHQAAAREYLEAYKLMPESPLINLCAGTALISLTLGFRLQNKHQCLTQGFAFLYNNLRHCENSQEALYNIARAYHHVGLVSLAASYYEKVIATRVKDYPIPKLPYESGDLLKNKKPGYCDLRREAAYNLHLIYKKSGAFHLARQVLKDHCTL